MAKKTSSDWEREWNDIGKEIRGAVQDAINSQNFGNLNRQITNSVNEALQEIQNALQGSGARSTAGDPKQQAEMDKERAGEAAAQRAQRQKARAEEALRRIQEAQMKNRSNAGSQNRQDEKTQQSHSSVRETLKHRAELIARKPKGKVSNVLFTVFGSILIGLAVLFALIFGLIGLTGEIVPSAMAVLLGLVVAPVGSCGITMLIRGTIERNRLERFQTYVGCIQDKTYLKISDLAAAVHKSEKYVRKDLKKMIEMDMFPQGHISEEQNLFILDDTTYAEYETMRQEVELKSRKRKEETPAQQQMRETVERGQAYLDAIRKANDAIPGVEISEKLFRLENAVSRIYTQIQKSPEKLPELRRFQDYYLPTTLKLVETYREFDGQPLAGENITSAKKEIEASLDTINQAFEKLFDSLFAETAMDVSTDISVLQTLLAQEGLTESAWKEATEPMAEYLKEEPDMEKAVMK